MGSAQSLHHMLHAAHSNPISSKTQDMRCCTAPRTVALAIGASVAVVGWTLSNYCVFEVGCAFCVQTLFILLWCCSRRPLLCFTGLYLCALGTLLVRETALAFTGRVPCGLVTFGSACVETRCVQKKYFLFVETGCARYECAHTEREEESHVFSVGTSDIQTVWLESGMICVWCAFASSVFQLRRWCVAAGWHGWRQQDLASPTMSGTGGGRDGGKAAEHVGVILAVPATYGLCAVHALRVLTTNPEDAWSAEAMIDVAELFSAVALYAFQRLLVVYVDSAVPTVEMLGTDVPSAAQSAQPSEFEGRLRRGFQRLIAVGLMQYVFLVFGCNALLVVLKAWDWVYPGTCVEALPMVVGAWFPHHQVKLTIDELALGHARHTRLSSLACEDLWNTASLLMVVADFFTCSIALFAIFTYERTFADLLWPVQPFWKFWGVKGLLSINFLQTIVLMAVGAIGGDAAVDKYNRAFLTFYLLCVEALLLAVLNIYAYPPVCLHWTKQKVDLPVEVQATSTSPDCEVVGISQL